MRWRILLGILGMLLLGCEKDFTGVNTVLRILEVSPPNGATQVDKHTPIHIRFSSPVHPDSLLRYITAWNRTTGERQRVSSRQGFSPPPNPNTQIDLYPILLHQNSEIEVTIHRGLKALDGSVLQEDYTWQFHVREDSIPLYLLYITPPPGDTLSVGPHTEIRFEFSDPTMLDTGHVTVVPDTPEYAILTYTIEPQSGTNFPPSTTFCYSLLWQDSLLSDTTYTITLDASITDYEGDSLGQDVILRYPVR